jgi:hypothetical protein
MQAALQTRHIILASSPNQTQKLKNQMTQTRPTHSIMTHGVQLKFYLLFSFYLAKSTRLHLQYSNHLFIPPLLSIYRYSCLLCLFGTTGEFVADLLSGMSHPTTWEIRETYLFCSICLFYSKKKR